MEVKLDNKVIEYNIDKGNRKNIYIYIKDGMVIIKVPKMVTDKQALEIIESKKKWILKKLIENNNSTKKLKDEEYYKNEKEYKKLAEAKIPEIMEKMINLTGLNPNEYRLVNFKRAWGNCSNKKIIKLNYKLVMYSDFAITYVCLHELCHLKYMNHSKNFWSLVEKYMPNYKMAEMELK